jgi:hypothetical protein
MRAPAAGWVRSRAERIVVLLGNEPAADHPRHFRRHRIIYDPWHYQPVLMKKPGAFRNGAPFKDLGICTLQTPATCFSCTHPNNNWRFA